MTIALTRTVRTGDGEVIRLPQEVSFGDGVELIVARSGDVMTIYPLKASIADMIDRLRALPLPPVVETRDVELIPEREGL